MIIRRVRLEDLEKVSVLFDAYRVFYRKVSDQKAGKVFLEARIKNQESIMYVAENEQGIFCGFVQLYPIFSSTRMKKLWLLNDLFVDPDYRGKGISVLLIDEAKKLAINTDACGLLLETEKTNHIGNSLYPKTGFVLNTGSNFYEWDNH